MARNDQFTIGWISPIPLEMEAARLVFDETYPKEQVQYRNTFYLGGRIGEHKVVIGVPTKMGLSPAAVLATKMRAGFPNIKYLLLVGIAGGVPRYGSAGAVSEIVLGDVVVSSPRGSHGGVVQYDKGAWQGDGRLRYRGHTDGVSGELMVAVNNLRAEGQSWLRTNISESLEQMRQKLDEERKHQYDDPGPGCDKLFSDEYRHQGTSHDDCERSCDAGYSTLRLNRGENAARSLDKPTVHFGNIASSNQLQTSATERNRLQKEHDVICFEMEAAGVLGECSCVVIRGICDYADSHKNKGWQNYAAATAAACAKVLLSKIPSVEVARTPQPLELGSSQPMASSYHVTFGNHNKGFQAGSIFGNISGLQFGVE